VRVLFPHTDGFGGHGGIAKFNRDLLHALAAHPRISGIVAVPRLVPGDVGPLPPKVRHVTLGVGPKWRYVKTVARVSLGDRELGLVLCGHINLLPLAWSVARPMGLPLALVVHGIEAWEPISGRLSNRFASRVDHFIAVSSLTASRFAAWSGVSAGKGYVLPNTIDVQRFRPGPPDPALLRRYDLERKTVVMTLGRISSAERTKGFDEVLEILPELARHVPNVAYLIAGDGDDTPRLARKAAELGVSDRVRFTGYIEESEKEAHYRLADVFAMPSRGEGFGIVNLEAMACGVPVVASTADGSREALRDGLNGRLVDPTDPKALLQAILASIRQPKGVPEGLGYFSVERFEARVHQFLTNVPARGGRGH